jgi:UDP-GlcNAc:undecaprenyl-phosphate GlcNAc-1-phosphate transferase
MKLLVIAETFVISGLISFILTLTLAKIVFKNNLFDKFNSRIFEEKKTPRVGGISIFFSLFISILFVHLLVTNNIAIDLPGNINIPLLIIAALIIFSLGLYDDFIGTNAWNKFIVQVIAASVIYFAGFKIAELSIPFIGSKGINDFLSFLLTILWICGITNAINIIDGIDGLAAGISFFAALSMGVLAFLSSQFLLVLIIAVLSGVLLGFYPFNFPKAKIYLGDSGSLVIGFMLACLSLVAIQRKASLAIVLLIPIIILFLPILETIITIIRRIYKKQNIFKGDTGHFHYRFLQKKISETKTTIILISISFLFSVSGILFEFVNTEIRILLLIFIFIICFSLLRFLGYIKINLKNSK